MLYYHKLNGDFMKIMTFNVQHCLDYKRNKIDTSFFVDAIGKYAPDVCGLNEIRGKGPRIGYTDQTKALGDGLGYYRYFAEAIKVGGKNPYGNAIVSRFRFKATETIPIPDPVKKTEKAGYETRCVLKAIIKTEDKEICFLVCHMGLVHDERVNAVNTICNIIDKTELPIVLMGDFNTTPDDVVLKPLYDRLYDTDGKAVRKGCYTYASYEPKVKIDYIFYRGLECKSVETIEEIYSDHFPIVAEFE